MTRPFGEQAEPGAFISTTQVFDESLIKSLKPGTPAFNEFLVHLSRIVNELSLLTNIKDTGYYVEEEFVCGQAYFPLPALTVPIPASGQYPILRQVFRKVIDFGALPNNGTTSVAHNITTMPVDGATNYPGFTFTRIYAAASDTTNEDYIMLPYVAGSNGTAVSLDVDNTNVIITTTDNKSVFNVTYVVLEYIKE